MYLPKILILKYSKIPRSLLNTTTTLIYTQHTLYILSYNKTLLSGRKVHAYLALFLAISSSSLVSSTLLLHSVSLQVLLEMLELCNQVSTHGIHLGTRVLDCAHAQPLKSLKFGGKSEFWNDLNQIRPSCRLIHQKSEYSEFLAAISSMCLHVQVVSYSSAACLVSFPDLRHEVGLERASSGLGTRQL